MKKIELTQGKVALVDDDMFEELNAFKWYAFKGGNTFYTGRNLPRVNGKQTRIKMDCVILGKPPKGSEIDHRNGRGLDNQRHNLRFVTIRQNQQNQQNRKNGKKTSQYPGVCWHKNRKKWVAIIQINGKQKHLGCFIIEAEAFVAYKQAIEFLGQTVIGNH